MMDRKLVIVSKGGGEYFAQSMYKQLENEMNFRSLRNQCGLYMSNSEILLEGTGKVLPIIVPKFDKVSRDSEADNIEITIKFPSEDLGEEYEQKAISKYGNFIHYIMRGLQDYVDSKIVLNVDDSKKEIHLVFAPESDYIPEFHLVKLYDNDSIVSLLKGF